MGGDPVSPILAAALLCLLVAIVFSNVFKNDFVGYDDQNLVVENQRIRSLAPANIVKMFAPRNRGNYQPIRELSYALDYAVWGMRPSGYLLTNVILHALGVIGVWLLARRLVPGPVAFLAAVIFAAHPVHVESVTWISGRKDVLCLVFFLAAILLHEAAEERGKPILLAAAVAATGLALLSKLTAVTIPFCIILLDVCRNGLPVRADLGRKILRLVPHALLVCLVIGLNFLSSGTASSHGDALAGLESGRQVATLDIWLSMPLVVCRYIGLLFVPWRLNTHYDVTRISGILEPGAFLPIAFLLALAFAGVVSFFRGRKITAFCIGWFAIAFLPTSNLVPTAAMMVDRYMHIPSIGFSILLAAALYYPIDKLDDRERPAMRIGKILPAVVLVLLLCVLTVRRNSDWRGTESLFRRTLLASPKSVDAHMAIGAVRMGEGDIGRAIEHFNDAIDISPDHYRVLYNLGVAYQAKGWIREATDALERSRNSNPDYLAGHFNLALVYHEQKRYTEAIAEHMEVLRLDPSYALSHGDLGRIYMETGEFERTSEELDQALRIDPDLIPALTDRAFLFTMRGLSEEADRDLERLESLGVDTGGLMEKTRIERERGRR